tara:strand:+ start:319 stop:1080 length:762 start_codon:yes stop_codon:yes gene_type:complete
MLSNSVKKSLQIAQIQKLQAGIVKSDLDKFTNSVELSKVVCKVHVYLTSISGKQVIKSQPEKFNTQEKFVKEYLGICKQWFNDLKNTGRAIEDNPQIVEEYLTECAKVEATGTPVTRSIFYLLKFYKESKLEKPTNESAANESEANESEAENTTSVVEKVKDVLTLSFAGKDLGFYNVSVRIGSDGQFKTSNSAQQIGEAVSYLLKALKGSGLMDVETPVIEAGTGTAKKKAVSKKAKQVKELHEFFTTDSAE